MPPPDFILGSPEHLEWMAVQAEKQKRYSRRRVRYGRKHGLYGYDKPFPGEVDWEDEEEG
ncbi:MAG: hypothetical protein ACK4FB_08245 [Brevundimonas sp.]|uniref:hypothetical protein n=1 Tax=Brevundimonas sp. TaxID=1871086 RepID=UPI00391A3A2E